MKLLNGTGITPVVSLSAGWSETLADSGDLGVRLSAWRSLQCLGGQVSKNRL